MTPRERKLAPQVTRCMDLGKIRAIFSYEKKNRKKMSYGHGTGCNLLPADADGIISPDILLIVHQAKG